MSGVNPLCAENSHPIGYKPIIPSENLYRCRGGSLEKREKFSAPPSNDIFNIEQDYIDLFSDSKKGNMAKYVHMYRPHIYDDLLKQESYYPFKMECDILEQKMDQITKSLRGITQVLEVGPGSSTPIMTKTVPLLKALQFHSSIVTYKAIDFNIEYAKQACKIIKRNFNCMKTESIESNFLSANGLESIKEKLPNKGKNLVVSFGQSIFANNNDHDIDVFIKNIGALLKKEDYLLFGVDTNHDERILERCYNTELVQTLLLNVMYYLKNNIKVKTFDPEAFGLVYKWNRVQGIVELYLKPLRQQCIKIRDQEFFLTESQEFNIINSRKFDLCRIENWIGKVGLKIKEKVTFSNHQKNSFFILVAQKH